MTNHQSDRYEELVRENENLKHLVNVLLTLIKRLLGAR